MRLVIVFVTLFFTAIPREASASRAIPDDNLAYPVLITLKSGTFGSGFFLNTSTRTYLVTARHVLFSEPAHELLSTEADLLSYSKDPKESTPNRIHLDLATLNTGGRVKMHPSRDVVVVEIAVPTATTGGPKELALVPGVTLLEKAPLGIVGVSPDTIKKYANVLVANEVIVFGYPRSLGLKEVPQLDASRPLLRKGIIAGLNDSLRAIILDCPAYPGNSGGPVLEAEREGLGVKLHIIGVISQFVPNAEVWVNTTHGYSNTNISNSGYSLATPMDFVLELVAP